MNNIVIADGITINVGEKPINVLGHEQELSDAIDALNNATITAVADEAFSKLVSLRNCGVIFPTNFMFDLTSKNCNRLPSIEVIGLLPGACEIYEEMTANWKYFTKNHSPQTYAKRVLINLGLSTCNDSILDISPDVFKAIMRSWKKPNGCFLESVVKHVSNVSVINNIARYLSRHNKIALYEQSTKQPRSDTEYRRGFGVDFVLSNSTEDNELWINLFNEWLNSQNIKSTKRQKNSFFDLLDWVKGYPNEAARDPKIFLSQPRFTPSLIDFLKNGSDTLPKERGISATYIFRFTQWIIDTYMRDVDEDGEVSIGVNLLTYSDQQMLQGVWCNDGKPSETTSKPLPTAWSQKALKIITDNDYAWPKSLSNQYFDWFNSETGEYEEVWVPVLANLFETMLEIPLRRFQVLNLDSGEGDDQVYDPENNKWVKNTGPAAGYWEKDVHAKLKKRGVIKDFSKPGKPLVGFHINTNKTADRNAPDGERTGYPIPWQNESMIKLFTGLRIWQEKYNPQTEPTPFTSLATKIFGYDPTETAAKLIPDRFYLFRTPCGNDSPFHPPAYNVCLQFWNELMAQLERVLKDEGEDITIVERWNRTTGQPAKVAFNIHGLRVATLTAFAESGVPIEILSKLLAGHASILMTIYYLKFNEASISQLLCEKAIEIKGNAAEQLKRHLENKSWENAKRIAVYNDEENFRSIMSNCFSPLWSNEGYGICPHGGTRCEDGGPIVRKNGKSPVYGNVPGGKHNCLRCRHFISGTPFLIQMWMKTNKLLSDSQKMAVEYDGFVSELKKLDDQKYRLLKAGRKDDISGKMITRIKELEGVCDLRSSRLNETLMDLHAAWRFTVSIKALFKNDECKDDNLPALLSSSNADFDFDFREGTRFEIISYILQASRIYSCLEDENLELERERFLDVVALRENLMPLCLAPLTKEEKRMAADAESLFLLTKVGAYETQQVYEGKLTLKDLGLKGEFKKVIYDVVPQLAEIWSPRLTGEFVHG